MNILTWLVTFAIIFAPFLGIKFYFQLYKSKQVTFFPHGTLLIAAGLIYPIARVLPEPHIFEATRTFMQHFVGGGFVSFLYYLYFKKTLGWNLNFVLEIIAIYAFVSSMGVANELLEFLASSLKIYRLDGSDVWYDLLANTSGAFLAYTTYRLLGIAIRRSK